MKNRFNNDKGFTLIELVMVIVILGILAAVAIPRFVDLQGSARTSVAAGITGALAGQITMLHAQLLLNTSSTYTVGDITGSVEASGFALGDNSTNVITATLDDGTIYTWDFALNGGDNSTFQQATLDGPNS